MSVNQSVSVIDEGKSIDHVGHGHNTLDCLDILLFGLGTGEVFGINVLKIREITQNITITKSPNLPNGIEGFVSMRGAVIPIFDLNFFFNHQAFLKNKNNMVIVLDCFSLQFGFRVHEVFGISRVNVSDIMPWRKEKESDKSCIVSILNKPEHMVSIIDVEEIVWLCYPNIISGFDNDPSNRFVHYPPVFVVDDSSLCRKYLKDILESLGLSCKCASGGLEAKECLLMMASRLKEGEENQIKNITSLVILDQELPQISGYSLVRFIRSDYRLAKLPVIIHTSLSKYDISGQMSDELNIAHHVFKFDVPSLVQAIHRSID